MTQVLPNFGFLGGLCQGILMIFGQYGIVLRVVGLFKAGKASP
ncbi:MAG: hypothetical protein ACFNZJ_04100 [Parascardovia denticolens]